jgi:hypothetical protein
MLRLEALALDKLHGENVVLLAIDLGLLQCKELRNVRAVLAELHEKPPLLLEVTSLALPVKVVRGWQSLICTDILFVHELHGDLSAHAIAILAANNTSELAGAKDSLRFEAPVAEDLPHRKLAPELTTDPLLISRHHKRTTKVLFRYAVRRKA